MSYPLKDRIEFRWIKIKSMHVFWLAHSINLKLITPIIVLLGLTDRYFLEHNKPDVTLQSWKENWVEV